MSVFEPAPLHLRRIDASRNMRRFYLLSIQPTLFGGATLVRNWGRVGSSGQTMMQTFDDRTDAGGAFDRLERAKRRRGYGDASAERRPDAPRPSFEHQ